MADRVDDIGYFLLFVYSFGGGFIGLATAAVLSSLGKLSLGISILLAGGANFMGSTLLFYFARMQKAETAVYLKKHRRKLALAHLLMKKWGLPVIFVQKFIYGVKTIVPLAAGMTKYEAPKFITINFIASFVWAVVIGVAAYLAGDVIMGVIDTFGKYPFIAPVALAAIVGAIYYYMIKTTKKENKI